MTVSSSDVHPTAVVDEGAEIGEGTRVWHFCHVSGGAKIGPKCSLGQNVFIARGVPIGAGVKIQNNVSVYEGVEIRDEAFLGPSCVFTNVNNPRSFIERKTEYRRTIVGRGASIGANATIVCGHDVGEYAFVGAGAVVTKNVPAHALVVGNPAKRIGWMSRAGLRLPEGRRPRCPQTGEEYVVDGETCRLATDDELAKEAEAPIPLLDLHAQNGPLMPEIRAAFDRVAAHGGFILGKEVDAFEKQIATYLGVPHAIGVSSGTDALLLALMALGVGPGHEVVTTPFSFFATAGCIARVGAKPVFVDVDPATHNLDVALVERALTPATKAIMPVHLFGQACAPKALVELAERRGIPIIEDAAQAVGARAETGNVGAIGAVGCFSFFPSKNLGCFGDGGLCTTRDPALAERMRVLRAHGGKPKYYHAEIGGNFRLDALQAAILSVKLPHLEHWTAARRTNAALYTELLSEGARRAGFPPERLSVPREVVPGHVWNQYVIRSDRRDRLRARLTEAGIGTEVYYPVPLHRQACFERLGYSEGSLPEAERAAKETLALPVFPELGHDRLRRVARAVLEAVGD